MLTYGYLRFLTRLIERLRQTFGDTDYVSDSLKFDFTDYYEPEMGTGLQRRLVSFASLIMPDELPAIKLATNALEDEFAGPDAKRTLNIDPGYIALCHLILATGKGENEVRVLDKTKLPSGTGKQAPDEKTVAVPSELYRDGSLRISFRNEAQPNVVVSELWLWESEAER